MVRRHSRILLADAEPNFARVLCMALEKKGCEVHIATDGLEALTRVRDESYDLAIVDAGLPVMDGLQVMTMCADVRPRLPVIITSTYEVPGLRQQARDGGAYAFVVKPSDGARLAWLAEQSLATKPAPKAVSSSPLATLRRLPRSSAVALHVTSGEHSGTYASTFLERHTQFLVVAGPRSARGAVSLAMGTRLSVGFGLPDGWYTFSSRVVGEDLHRRPPSLLVEPPMSVSRKQRRRHARVPTVLPAVCRPLRAEARSAKVHTENIGLGGVGLLAARRLNPGTPVAISLVGGSCPEGLDLSGEVVWAQRCGRLWRTGIKFLASSGERRSQRARLVSTLRAHRTR